MTQKLAIFRDFWAYRAKYWDGSKTRLFIDTYGCFWWRVKISSPTDHRWFSFLFFCVADFHQFLTSAYSMEDISRTGLSFQLKFLQDVGHNVLLLWRVGILHFDVTGVTGVTKFGVIHSKYMKTGIKRHERDRFYMGWIIYQSDGPLRATGHLYLYIYIFLSESAL